MSETVVDDIVSVLPPLLTALDALGFVARQSALDEPWQQLLHLIVRTAAQPNNLSHCLVPLRYIQSARTPFNFFLRCLRA